MLWFKKQPKIEFICSADIALANYPIIEARKFMPEWFTQATTEHAKDLLALKESNDLNAIRDVSKCSGIRKLLKTGWIARTYQDMHLKVSEGGFEWTTPLDQSKLNKSDLVAHHSPDSFRKCPRLKNKAPVLKIQLPWVVKIPEGYNLVQMPLFYWDEPRFTTATGIFDRRFGPMELNIQLLWESGDGEFLIKAGTPLAQLVLIPDVVPAHSIRLATEEELKQSTVTSQLKACSYNQNYAVIKNNIKKYLEG